MKITHLSIEEQVRRVRTLFPTIARLGPRKVVDRLLHDCQGLCIPHWECIAPTYSEALHIVLTKLRQQLETKFGKRYDLKPNSTQLNLGDQTDKLYRELREQQPGADLLLVPAKFDIFNPSPGQGDIKKVHEQGVKMGAFAVCVMLLVHADLLVEYTDIQVNIEGDEHGQDDEDPTCRYVSLFVQNVHDPAWENPGMGYWGFAAALPAA